MPYSANCKVGDMPVKLSDVDYILFNGFCKQIIRELGITMDGSDEMWQMINEYIDSKCNMERCDVIIRAFGARAAMILWQAEHSEEDIKTLILRFIKKY
jgi:hypothetical protein